MSNSLSIPNNIFLHSFALQIPYSTLYFYFACQRIMLRAHQVNANELINFAVHIFNFLPSFFKNCFLAISTSTESTSTITTATATEINTSSTIESTSSTITSTTVTDSTTTQTQSTQTESTSTSTTQSTSTTSRTTVPCDQTFTCPEYTGK